MLGGASMSGIYDNGSMLLGNIRDIILKVEKEIKEDEDNCLVDAEELLKDLNALFNDYGFKTIVCVNYENGMGYTIDYWTIKDKVVEQ